MADRSRLEIIGSNPIGTGLDDFRNSFSCAVHQMSKEDLKNRTVDLIARLQNLPAARSLPRIAGRGTLRNDLQRLEFEFSAAESGDFDLESLVPLLDAVLNNGPDELIWNKAYDAVTKRNNFAKSSEHHELKEKMGSMMYDVFLQALPPPRPPGQPPLVRKGWQGVVRLETDPDGRKIAVKTIYYGDRKNVAKAIVDFQRECDSLQALPHPSIVRFLGSSHNPGLQQAVLRMEWAATELSESGRADLGDIISSRLGQQVKDGKLHHLPEIFLWHVLFHLGAALALCHHGIELNRTRLPARVNSEDVLFQLIRHSSNDFISLARENSHITWTTEQVEFSKRDPHPAIVHRDIKPSNVLLSDPPRDASAENWGLNSNVSLENSDIFRVYPIILLGDFGLSAPLKDAHTRAVGTFEYCAPEVPREPSRPDSPKFDWTTQCDIFSLGATLWHLMNLQGPPERPRESDPLPPLPSSYSDGLQRLITKCCEWKASHRPTAIDILVACIERSYWNETYVSPYGLPIAFDFTTTLWKSLQRIIPKREPLMVSMHDSSPFSHSLNLLSLSERTGEPLSTFVAGAYITQHFRYKPNSIRREKEIEILQRLRISPYRDQKDRNPDRAPGTCDWFVSHSLFRNWQESKSSRMLWVSADPGCGKSVLAKYLVDSVLPSTESRTVCYFFFRDDFEDQRNVVSALCCILHQLFEQKRILLSDAILDQFDVVGEKFTSSFGELWQTLINAAEDGNAGEIVCLLDAIDECEDQGRSQLAQALRHLYGTGSAGGNFNLKFLLTSRPYIGIRRSFQPLEISGLTVIHLSGESEVEMKTISQEIGLFIRARVRDLGERLKLTYNEQDLLLQQLMRVPNSSYLWVHLTLELIQSDIYIDRTGIIKATSQLPKTLEDAYEKILSKSHNPEQAKKILHIVMAAARPLTLREMTLALALRENHGSYDDLDLEPEDRFLERIRDTCGLFVKITDSRIYLLHQTAREFLVQRDTMNFPEGVQRDLIWKHSLRPRESHRILAEICIWHLLLTEFETHPLNENGSLSQYVMDHIFLDYSAKHWAVHLRELPVEMQDAMTQSILRICETSSRRFQAWFRIYWTSINTDFPQGFTTLMIASYFGLGTAVKHLLKMGGIELNSRDNTHKRSALSWAAENGFDVVIKLLLKGAGIGPKGLKLPFGKGAEVDSVDKYGRTPLSYGVWSGNVTVVKLLIKAGARMDSKDKIGGTPLSYAICSGHEEVNKLLLKKGTQVGSMDDIGNKLLLSAAEKGDEAVVRLLLETGRVDHGVKDQEGRTPLSRAAENGHGAVVKLLQLNRSL